MVVQSQEYLVSTERAERILQSLDSEEDNGSSLTELAYKQLEELIVTLQLPPGEVISEADIASKLEIGRTPVREALQRLAREGLVNILFRRGILITDLDVSKHLRLLEIRRELERLMAKLAVERSTDAEREAFGLLELRMREVAVSGDEIEFMTLDRQVNLLLCRVSRNEYIQNAMNLTHGQSRRFWFMHRRTAVDLKICASLHAELVGAVYALSETGAMAASDKLMDYIEEFSRNSVGAVKIYNSWKDLGE